MLLIAAVNLRLPFSEVVLCRIYLRVRSAEYRYIQPRKHDRKNHARLGIDLPCLEDLDHGVEWEVDIDDDNLFDTL